jgi:hypothetical protein
MITASQQITDVPTNIWFVHVNGTLDTKWGSRKLARSRKTTLRNYGVTSPIQVGSSQVILGNMIVDSHS